MITHAFACIHMYAHTHTHMRACWKHTCLLRLLAGPDAPSFDVGVRRDRRDPDERLRVRLEKSLTALAVQAPLDTQSMHWRTFRSGVDMCVCACVYVCVLACACACAQACLWARVGGQGCACA